MSATRARKLRREKQQVIANVSEQILDMYEQDPNAALSMGYQLFGRDNYNRALRSYLHQNLAKVAFILAAKKCLEKGEI